MCGPHKAPCTYLVNAWALKLVEKRNPFKARLYIYIYDIGTWTLRGGGGGGQALRVEAV